MKQALYLFFYNIIRKENIACVFTHLAYIVITLRYYVTKWFSRKRIINEEKCKSRDMVAAIAQKPVSYFEIVNSKNADDLDLSVIIPVYNYENVLEEMIGSVLNQKTRYQYEVILIDDGSREPAKEILRKYENEPCVVVIYQKNQGISGARNTGLNVARGRYVMFVDCDDVLHDNIIERLMREAEETNADIVIGGHALVKQKNGVEISRRDDIYPLSNLEKYQDGDSIMNYPGLPWGKVYKRELFEKVRFPVNYWYEDTIVHFLLFRLAKTYSYVPEVLYDYRWYEGNYSKVQSKSNTRVVEHYWIVEYMLEESRRIGLKPDAVLYKVLLRHLGSYLYPAIAGLPESDKISIFNLACHLVEENRIPMSHRMNLRLRELEASFLNRDYTQWVLASTKL